MTGLTARVGLKRIANLLPGNTLLMSTASGTVFSTDGVP